MAFRDYPGHKQSIELLQRSLERGRLAHAYLFTGPQLEDLEALARTFAKALNCQKPPDQDSPHTDSCDACSSCRKIEAGSHPDIYWIRPESKSRIITVEQMRNLMKEIQLKPNEAEYKVAIVVAADRLRVEAANAFLKTLEEPPAKSILLLLSTEPQRLLDTILSRCLRLNVAGSGPLSVAAPQHEWLSGFSEMAAAEQKSLLGRYRLLDVLLRKLTEVKEQIEENLTARSPLQQYKDADKAYIERWEDELASAIEAEYRHQRAELVSLVHWWLRDVWIQTLRRAGAQTEPPELNGRHQGVRNDLLSLPEMPGTAAVANRISADDALQNLQTLEQLQRWLHTNVQEALALEVGLLKLKL